MGGLVAQEAILSEPELASRVPILVTYSTPYDGASIAEVAATFLRNPGLDNMRSVNSNNAFLESLRNRWKRAKDGHRLQTVVRCAYETVPLPGVGLVVQQTSGEALCDGPADPIAEDHLGIVKPVDGNHDSVRVLVNALREVPKPPPLAERGAFCQAEPSQRPPAPPGFDLGYSGRCNAYLYINDDDICDYCRLVGDGNSLRCTLGTTTGLNGLDSDVFRLEQGAPYPGECTWVKQSKGVLALQGTIGNNHEKLSITPVRVVEGRFQMGPTTYQAK
jgi:hypothetical protein